MLSVCSLGQPMASVSVGGVGNKEKSHTSTHIAWHALVALDLSLATWVAGLELAGFPLPPYDIVYLSLVECARGVVRIHSEI